MLVISSREFRQNQKLYFVKADEGEQIIVQPVKDKEYSLTPVKSEYVFLMQTLFKESKKG